MSNITRLMDAKPSHEVQPQADNTSTSPSSSRRTVEELLKMLTGNDNVNVKKAPPVPPKPRLGLEKMTPDEVKRNFLDCPRPKANEFSHLDVKLETLLHESHDRPPRTSTPSSAHCPLDSTSSSGASTATNNNRSSQNTHFSAGIRDNNSDQTDEDTFNISRDTDELTNTSAHNQSGCELIGINDQSDRSGNSKESPKANSEQDKVPYSVQIFDDTIMSTSPTQQDEKLRISQIQPSSYEQDSRDLHKVVTSMQDEIIRLNNQVSRLATKVNHLESELEDQKKNVSLNHSASNIYGVKPFQQETLHSASDWTRQPFSQSTNTLNRLTPSNQRQNSSYTKYSTYSRNNTTNSRNPSPFQPKCGTNSTNYKSSCNNNNNNNNYNPRSLKKLHASTNSLYPDSNRSLNSSISPIGQNNRQSPNSLSSLSNKRDPSTYTSMLSLSSIGNSTLKKGLNVSGSVTNLSQMSNQLSNWPSISDFVSTKHRAKDILYDEEERTIRMVLYNILITMRLPPWIENDYDLDKVVEPPPVKLKLDWVYGYRGRDCRSNIYYLPTGECVYFVASIVVLYHTEEKTQRHYLGHTDSVKCLAVHPNKLIVASGQSAVLNRRDKRPIVRVWNTVSLATLRVIGFNEDFDRSICCLAFSKHDQGATLAVVDESSEHTITLLDWQREKNWRLAETNSGHESVLAIDFHPIDKYSLVAVGKSGINFWDIRGMTLAKKAGLFDKYDRPKYVLCMTFNDSGETITGDSNGNVIIWPRGSNRPKRIIHDAHIGGVFSVLAMKDGSYLTGGRDRRIVEWDENFMATGREAEIPEHCGGVRFITHARGAQVLIGTLRNSILTGSLGSGFSLIMQGHSEATSALAIHPNLPQYLTGGFDDQIHLFDTRAHRVLWSKCIMTPASAASFSLNGYLLIVGSISGKWLVIDAITQEILFTSSDGTGTINCIKFSPCGEFFCLGSSDSQIYIYQTTESGNTFSRIGTCVGHSAPIKEIDWSDDSRYIQSQSMNFELLFWGAYDCRPVDEEDIVAHLKWHTHNCSLGFNVIGIWSDSIDSALINHCDKSNSDDLIVSVTDTGNINIYKWPTCYNQCLSKNYYGNVEKFNFIKFLHDDSRLIAVGAKNCVTTEWIIDKGESSH